MLVVKYCTLAQRHQLRCVFHPFSPEDLFQPSQRPGQCMRALFLRAVVIGGRQSNLRRRPLPSTCGCMPSARSASPWFRRPRFELGLLSRAPQVSAKRVRLSCTVGSRPLVRASRCTQRWLVHATLVVITLCANDQHARCLR